MGELQHGLWLLPYLWASVPDLEEAVPGPRGHSHPIIGHTQAADTVVVPSQDTWRDHSTGVIGAEQGGDTLRMGI